MASAKRPAPIDEAERMIEADCDILLASLPLDTAARLALKMQTPARKKVRDRAIVELCRSRYGALARSAAAKALQADLQAASGSASHSDDALCAMILAFDCGHALRWRQIEAILDGWHGW
jgi:hypothetical protein